MIRFVDLFAGIGGLRLGFEQACQALGMPCECICTSEIKKHAIKVYKQNFRVDNELVDVTKIENLPQFDYLLAGFPCQPFSSAGKQLGFEDTRGTLFFEIARILKCSRPKGFILENVEGLITHDSGNTLRTILSVLTGMGYKTIYKVLDSQLFGVPQRRKRIYIVGTLRGDVSLEFEPENRVKLGDVLEDNLSGESNEFITNVLSRYSKAELIGKHFTDKRGGNNNIHSWDIALRGQVSKKEKELLNLILLKRRNRSIVKNYPVTWKDGMPLTKEMIRSFYNDSDLDIMLSHLTALGYLRKEPIKLTNTGSPNSVLYGYNLTTGTLSFSISKILDAESICPTLVATDMNRLYVSQGDGLRKLSLREGLRLNGYPDDFKFEGVTLKEGYDLIGNTVVVPVIYKVASRLLRATEVDRNGNEGFI